MIVVECKDVSKRFGKNKENVLEHVNMQLEQGNIYALLGRNGAGKTTLLNCLCTKYLPDSGEIRIMGEEAYENEKALSEICFMSDQMDVFDVRSVQYILTYASTFYEKWNLALQKRLLEFFGISMDKLYGALSKGQKTIIGIIIGLCCGCEVVLLDEIYSGLDAATRQDFYEILLEEQERCPRTFVLSTHLIEEMTGLFTHVLILDEGRIILNEEMETIHSKSFKCVGRAGQITGLSGKNVVAQKEMGTIAEYVLYDTLTVSEKQQLEKDGFTVSSISLQELFIALTEHEAVKWGEKQWS